MTAEGGPEAEAPRGPEGGVGAGWAIGLRAAPVGARAAARGGRCCPLRVASEAPGAAFPPRLPALPSRRGYPGTRGGCCEGGGVQRH